MVSKRRYAENLSDIENVISRKSYATETKEFYEENIWIGVLIIAITVVSPLVGLILAGPPGIAVGLVLGVFSFLLGPKAIMKVRETTRKET